MAYRKADAQVPSFLDEFLEQIQTLPSHVKAKFAEMRELDDRAASLMNDAERTAADVVRKVATKSTGGSDPLKRAFQEVLACQGKAGECANRKVELAETAYRLIEDTIKSLDDKLREYEAQLKREGRWPASNVKSEQVVSRKVAQPAGSPALPASSPKAPLKAGLGTATLSQAGPVSGVPPNTKSRKRDREKERVMKEKVKAREAEAAAAAAMARTKEEAAAARAAKDMVVVEDAAIDPDEPRYCYCDQVSYGDMVACEGKGCPYEWFHYQCVGISTAPTGRWYCPECKTRSLKKNRKA